MAIALHRTFFPKKIALKPTKNRNSKLNKNNLRLFRFFNKLSSVLYLVASCDCFVIIIFPRKEKFELGYDSIALQCILHSTRDCNRGFLEVQIK